MAKLKVDKKALKRFQDRRPIHGQRSLELLGFASEDDSPLYCIPVLNEIVIPLSIASFASEDDFAPPVNFLIHTDEHDHVIPAGRHAKLLTSYLLDAANFNELRNLWHGLLQVRHANYNNADNTRFNQNDFRVSVRDGAEFFIRCLAFHEINFDEDMDKIRPILADLGISESSLDTEP